MDPESLFGGFLEISNSAAESREGFSLIDETTVDYQPLSFSESKTHRK